MPPKHSKIKPNSKQKETKPNALYSHFTYGHTRDYSSQKPQVKKNSWKTNKEIPKKIWVPKNEIIYVT